MKLKTLVFAVIAAGVLLAGCVTNPSGSVNYTTNVVNGVTNVVAVTNVVSDAQIDKTCILMKSTVRSALILVIDKNGTNATPYIESAVSVLNEFVGTTNNTPDALLQQLSKLSPKALGKPEVKLAISTVVTAYEIYYGDYVRGKVNGNVVATKLLTAIRDGCSDALLFK